VEKTSTPDLMRIEVEKTRRASQIGKRSGLFIVPDVLDYNEDKGLAVYQRLHIKSFSGGLTWGKQKINIATRLGRALATIHRDLMLPESMIIPLPEQLSFSRDEVFLHGDLSVSNVCVGVSDCQLIIIDWQMTPIYGGRSTYGTRYFDIMWFIANLILRPDMRFLFNNPVDPVVRAFLDAYFEAVGASCDPENLAIYAVRFFDVEFPRSRQEILQYSMVRSRLLLPFSEAILRSFLRSMNTVLLKHEIVKTCHDD
jgi:tRNA A-37 threonylcarbamoyl transferase component Bud32